MATPKLKLLTGDQTEIDVIVRGHGRVYHKRKRVSSVVQYVNVTEDGIEPDPTGVPREVEWLVALAGRELKRDMIFDSQPQRPTNPFAWSPGPTRWQYYK